MTTKKIDKATERPWKTWDYRVGPLQTIRVAIGNSHRTIARIVHRETDDKKLADAALIVKAVNCHDALLKMLKEAYAHLDYCGWGDKWERECAKEDKLQERILKAIAQVRRRGEIK